MLPVDRDGRLKAPDGVRAAHGVERRPAPSEGAARSLHQRRPRQSLRLRRRPGPRQDPDLPASIRRRARCAQRSCICLGQTRLGATTPGDGSRRGDSSYLINELDCTITVFSRDARAGRPERASDDLDTARRDRPSLPAYSTAEVLVHPSGKFLYGSNRGHDSIVVFAIDERSGRLTHVQHQSTLGSIPRGFGIDPSGAYLLAGNQKSDSVVVFRIDRQSGRLTRPAVPSRWARRSASSSWRGDHR